jgi:hypothetical protein
VPYPGACDTIGPAYESLVGLNLLRGPRRSRPSPPFAARTRTAPRSHSSLIAVMRWRPARRRSASITPVGIANRRTNERSAPWLHRSVKAVVPDVSYIIRKFQSSAKPGFPG